MESSRLADVAPDLERYLTFAAIETPPQFGEDEIRRETVMVPMRDGIQLATDLYLPPVLPAPAVASRTPYDRASAATAGPYLELARRGFVVISQDCRGTGGSEPDSWDYYVYEADDGVDFVEWVTRQDWYDGFLGSLGGSYTGQTQWCMSLHPRMSAIVPEVSGLGVGFSTASLYMFLNSYAKSVGKGADKVAGVSFDEMERLMAQETLAGGIYNEPLFRPLPASLLDRYPQIAELPPAAAQRRLWEIYSSLPSPERAALIKSALETDIITAPDVESLSTVFGQRISHDAHTIPHADPGELSAQLHAPALMITGWYDWCLNDALDTWALLQGSATDRVRSGSRFVIAPSAHNMPGYHEGAEGKPELQHNHRIAAHLDLLMHWYRSVAVDALDGWPAVSYYLMGANEWRFAAAWPPPESRPVDWYLGADGVLASQPAAEDSAPDEYVYDPLDPTPTVGGSIVSYVYPPGSVDVSEVQRRPDVLTYTTAPLERDLDVAGPLRLTLYASSSAVDTDFTARLSDVFPDGRAIQLQNCVLRARYRDPANPELLEPGRVYEFEIDMWATANRFAAGHRLRLDIASADFPKYDRNANLGGEPGDPVRAHQTIYHDAERPSRLTVSMLDGSPGERR